MNFPYLLTSFSYLPTGDPAYLAYLGVFAAVALGCLVGVWQARQVGPQGVRRGLVGLLLASGLWALAHVGMLLAPSFWGKTAFYTVGLTVGFGTVFAWFWLCSAFSGRSLHRRRAVWWGAAAVFALVTATKLTNPWHGFYFSAEWAAVPFRHLEVDHHVVYWLTAAFSYVLAGVGFFMLAEPLRKVKVGTGRLAALLGLTALPLGANAAGYAGPWFLNLSHEPVGVAAFALGALFVSRGRLEEAARLGGVSQTCQREKPTLILSDEERVRNYNRQAADLFPALEEEKAVGRELGTVLPSLRETLSGGSEPGVADVQVLETEAPKTESSETNGSGEAESRHFQPVETTFRRGAGRLVVLTDVTERELRRRGQEARLEAISRSMPGMAFEFRAGPGEDQSGGERSVEFVGAAAEDLLGLSLGPEGISSGSEEWYDRFVGRIPTPSREAFVRSVEEAIGGRSRWRKEFPFDRPDGERIWLFGSAEPEVRGTPDGEEVVFRGIFIDITERKRREQDLKESRRELRKEKRRVQSITENVSDGIYRSTAEEGIVYANQAFVEMFGYRDLGELRAAGPEALYVNPGRREELIEKENREGRLHQEEVRYRRKDGTTFIGLLNTQRVEGEDQEKTYFDGAVTDITERKRHEQKRRRRREDIEALYDATRSLLRAGDRGEVHDRIHAVLRKVFDYGLINKYLDRETIRAVQTDHSGDAELLPLTAGSASGDSIVAQVLRDGETVVAEDLGGLESDIDYGALRSAAGVPVGERGVIIVGQAEETSFDCFNLRLIEVLADYAALVLGRLGREEELIEAKTEAEEANQMKSAFLANMSHEIRTPLTNILGFAEAIEEETEGLEPPVGAGDLRPLGTFAGLIQRGGRRLMETLTGILTLSELEAGEMELEAEPVDLGAQACRVAEELRPKAEDEGLALTVEALEAGEGAPLPAGERPWALADEGGVQIVLQNLLSNAIKYTEEGEVVVRAYQDEEAAVLEVEDTGIGMEPEVAEGLFEPFRQASEGMSREYEGTGIGLTIMRKAIGQMDGSIEVTTEKGEGSRFTVRLPKASGKTGRENGVHA